MKNIIIGLVIIGLGIGGYFVFSGDKIEESAVKNTEEQAGKKMAFSEFIKNGGSYECTVSQNVAETTSVGTVFIDGEKIRGDFSSTVKNIEINTTFIAKEGFTYTWTSMIPNMVYKSAIKTGENKPDTSTDTSGSYSFNAETIGEYDCKDWTPDQTKFEIPNNVQLINI